MANTFFAQAERMDVRLGGGVNIPAAALNAFNTIGIIVLIPLVDKVVYPFFERIGRPLTYLKRIGKKTHKMVALDHFFSNLFFIAPVLDVR